MYELKLRPLLPICVGDEAAACVLTVSDDAVLAELPGHLLLQLLGLDCRHVGEVRPARRVDDAA